MKLFSAEFRKIFTRRSFICLFVAALLINAFLTYRNECVKYPMPQSYNKVYSDLAAMPQPEQLKYIEKQQKKMTIFELMELNFKKRALKR